MDADEISVVLLRASELHAKISDAIERALKSEFLLSAQRNANLEEIRSEQETFLEKGNAEARSLAAIRDALEVLEEQLEGLQAVQQQQRVERDAALSELEESRRILLNRLKSHRGIEWEVVREALAFAGEPADGRDELPLPPYPMPLPDSSSFVKPLANDIDGSPNPTQKEEAESKNPKYQQRVSILNLGKLFGHGIGVTASKAALIVASVITIILFSEMGWNKQQEKRQRQKKEKKDLWCPAGKVMILEDGIPKCVVKERIEIPFRKEVDGPDVLYGRG